MKKRYILMIALCTILFLLSSCDGSVNEKLFGGSRATTDSATTTTYKVGDTGPAGGIIFYINPNYEEGSTDSAKSWKYLEAGKKDLVNAGGSWDFKWSPTGVSCGTGQSIGDGLENTKKLAEKGSDYEAACAVYGKDIYDNGYTDWFIPSWRELEHLMKTFKSAFSSEYSYWSSTEEGTSSAYALDNKNGNVAATSEDRDKSYRVRPIRRF